MRASTGKKGVIECKAFDDLSSAALYFFWEIRKHIVYLVSPHCSECFSVFLCPVFGFSEKTSSAAISLSHTGLHRQRQGKFFLIAFASLSN